MHEIGLAKIYSCTKFDVSSFTHSRFMEEGLKFKILALDPDHAQIAPDLVQLPPLCLICPKNIIDNATIFLLARKSFDCCASTKVLIY